MCVSFLSRRRENLVLLLVVRGFLISIYFRYSQVQFFTTEKNLTTTTQKKSCEKIDNQFQQITDRVYVQATSMQSDLSSI